MHVSGFPLDLNWFIQFILTAFFITLALLHLVRNTASKYFMVDANFEPSNESKMTEAAAIKDSSCAMCGNSTTKQCSGCKLVKYCSAACQSSHWRSRHKTECKDFQISRKINFKQSAIVPHGRRGSNAVALVPVWGSPSSIKQSKEILFPYEDFVELYNWNKPGFPPCGLLNCGNSCFANVVLQCLSYTRPLVAYLLEKGHRKECNRNDWCFLCEFQTHIERASTSRHPFSPINILSRLPNIGGNLGYGKQEDAHEFMRFAIDTMQSLCLDEFGGEKVLHPSTQETTLIQHIFGGHLQSQVICSKCNNVSNQYENMMDLTVEIHGDAASLEECLDQFTAREQLHGDNMYKCDGCNDYVMAWKRLMVRRAPNILTIALKRFQSGRFGKLNKRVTFPETLDLSPYMIEERDGEDVYKLYAVVVHVDMLNASFFGHYICYTKDFLGNWYRIDDCKVSKVDLEDVLSEGAYMLLYSRVHPRPSCLKPIELPSKEQQIVKEVQGQEEPCAEQSDQCLARAESTTSISTTGSFSSDTNSQPMVYTVEMELPSTTISDDVREDVEMVDAYASPSVRHDIEVSTSQDFKSLEETASSFVYTNGLASSFGVEHKDRAESSEKVLTDSSAEKLQPMQNGYNDVPMGGLSSDDSELKPDFSNFLPNPVNSKNVMEKMETENGFLSSSGTESAVGKLGAERNSSGTRLKPLFAPGFLGKRPGSNSTKRERKAASYLDGVSYSCYQAKSGSVHENGLSSNLNGDSSAENHSA